MIEPQYQSDGVTLYLGDCLEILPTLGTNNIDAVVTDPPYGIGADRGVGGYGISATDKHYLGDWDNALPQRECFSEILRVGKVVIIFGANHFSDALPVGHHWIVWDKVGEIKFKNPYSDCELLWTNVDKNTIKKYVVFQQGFIAVEKSRFHPTQKPVCLMSAIIHDYVPKGSTVLDPFMGSGSTGVACIQEGQSFIGIEIDEYYFNIAKSRIETAQPRLL